LRRRDWPERLAVALREAEKRTWSETDYCVLFAADCVEAMTGVDYCADYRGLSIEESREKLRQSGMSFYRHLVSLFGKPVPLSFARRGDVIVRTDPEPAAGICCGMFTAFLSSDGGLAFLPTLEQRWAFRVP
jgi:hypothetical protein